MTTQNETAALVGWRFWAMEERLRCASGGLSMGAPYRGGEAPKTTDVDRDAHPNSRSGKEPSWLPYVAPLAIIAISAACAAFTVSVELPQQEFAAENEVTVAQVTTTARGIRTSHAESDSSPLCHRNGARGLFREAELKC
ncbi:MAG: hypothetical protein EOP82_27375 [Variovorax sp.]|nr:MAG: hypothetical protein EOP82_27375 [Variovorax sp.]